jgi:hypothetical protein
MRLRICFSAVAILGLMSMPAAAATRPPMRSERLAYWHARVADSRAWARFMYGTDRFRPRLIVEHWTASTTQDAAIEYWNSSPESTWVHFIIDRRGRITQLAPLDALAKQAYGVSPWAIGVEHVGMTDAEVMHSPRMLRASLRLACWLRQRLHIPLRGVIGHGEVRSSPRFHLTARGWRWIKEAGYVFHTDLSHRTMVRYRKRLRAVCGP